MISDFDSNGTGVFETAEGRFEITIRDTWNGGFVADSVLTLPVATDAWAVEFTLAGNGAIAPDEIWGAQLTDLGGGRYRIEGDGETPADEVRFTFVARGDTDRIEPASITLADVSDAGTADADLDIAVRESWNGGFVADATLESNASIADWRAEFVLEGDGTIADDEIWGARIVSRDGNRYIVEGTGSNEDVSAGETIPFTFVARGDTTGIEAGSIRVGGPDLGTGTPAEPTPPDAPGGETPAPSAPGADAIIVDFENHANGTRYDRATQDADWDIQFAGQTGQHAVVSSEDAVSGNNALKVTYPTNASQGLGSAYELPEEDEYYLSYWVKFEEGFDFDGDVHSGGKLPGLASEGWASGGATVDGTNGFTARYMWREDGEAELYLYHMDKASPWGDSYKFRGENGNPVKFQDGEWHQLVQRVKINSDNNRDGEIDVWMDGQQVLQLDGLRMVNDGSGIDSFYLSSFFGGSGPDWWPDRPVDAYFDDFIVSTNPADVGLADVSDGSSPPPTDPTPPVTPPEPEGDGEIRFEVVETWNGGFKAELVIVNDTGRDIEDWAITFADQGFDIRNIWGGSVSQQGDTLRIDGQDWATSIPAGGEMTFGFVADGPVPMQLSGATLIPSFDGALEEPVTEQPPTTPPADGGDPPPATPPGDVIIDGPGGPFDAADYAQVLNMSMEFYYAQYAGDLPDDHPVDWRGDSALNDGQDVGRDLSGGWFDAGDHVKFGFPMAATATMLSWGGLEFEEGYQTAGAYDDLSTHLRFVNDYFLNAYDDKGTADISDDVFHAQVGDGDVDHAWWGPPEEMDMWRPTYSIDAQNPGSDVAAETAAAMASASIFFREQGDTAYADTLLEKAIKLYDFAETYQGKYSDSVTDAQKFYNSFSGFQDELAWGANWLYQATGDESYLEKSKSYYNGNWAAGAQQWDDKSNGTAMLLAHQTGDARYVNDVNNHLNHWMYNIQTTPGTSTNDGLGYLDLWGSNSYATTAGFMASLEAKHLSETGGDEGRIAELGAFATDQLDYVMGDNPNGQSFIVGWGDDYPEYPHHRAASGTYNMLDPDPNEHVISGALVGGLDADGSFNDARNDWVHNEVAINYNAGHSGLVAGVVEGFTGTEDDAGWWMG
ncbi:glycoside hydrolase family 9 protein [Pontivivens ytuae]|uniref:Endoglucanase n=1 Tax=Pontivivens ytuae TaxID=2789856 RepID=A0A7S9LSM0_9RHOB|nr:glycoside hydrolase family 9 protein [Pontivivens ytuae]QPH54235.1 glycoside hydrolase family 9 protein [Pontivivens ytuae]